MMATPSHVDASILYVPIMPETSKMGPAMEQAGQDATESFGKGTKGLGDKIHDSIAKSKDKIKDVFHRTGTEAAESVADGVKENSGKVEDAVEQTGEKAKRKFREKLGTLGKDIGKDFVAAWDRAGPELQHELHSRIEGVVGGAVKNVFGSEGIAGSVGDLIGSTTADGLDTWLGNLHKKLGDTKDAADKTKAAFADFKSGDTLGGVSKLVDSFGQLGVEVKDLPEPLRVVIGDVGDMKGAAEDFAGVFKDLPGIIGRVGTAIEELAGPIGIAAAGAMTIWNGLPGIGGGLKQILSSPSTLDTSPAALGLGSPQPGGSVPGIPLPGQPQQIPAAAIPAAGQGVQYTATQGSLDPFAALLPPGMAPPDLSKSSPLAPVDMPDGVPPPPTVKPPKAVAAPPPHESVPTTAPAVPSSGATPSSFTSGASISASNPSDLRSSAGRIANLYQVAQSLVGTPYSQALRNDCSGMVSRLATAALGMNPSVQFSTVNEGDWLFSHGFKPGTGGPGDLSIGWYDHGGGNAGHTAATLPGGEHAESGGAHGDFIVGPGAAGADDPQFERHAYLPMGADGSKAPVGTQHDPLYVMRADAPSGGTSGGSDAQSLSEQFGQGFLGGVAQSVGLDGSVFKGFGGASNPANFGITKLATGFLNHLLTPASQGAAISNGVIPMGPGGAQNVRPDAGATYNFHGPINTGMSVTQNGVQSPTGSLNDMNNSSRTSTATLPNAGNLPSS